MINGIEAVRYYVAGFTDSYVNKYAINKATPLEYILEDRVYIKDPNLNGRIIYITYEEKTNKLPSDAKLLSGVIIKGLFNSEKHQKFENILTTVRSLPINTDQFASQSSKQLGVSFEVPKYWGNIVESIVPVDLNSTKERFWLSFKSPLVSVVGALSQIEFQVGVNYPYEGIPAIYQYSGQSLENACQNKAYLVSSGAHDITVFECNLRILPNGFKVVVFKGNYTITREYGNEETISVERRSQPTFFKGAIFRTRSTKWPGMSIHFEGTNVNFTNTEKLFDKVINSLSYSPISDSDVNTIIKNNWGVSFTKSSDWNVTSNTSEQLNLEQVSGEWTGDKIDISYISGTNITTTDAKFGSVTYYYDENSQRWMKIGQSEKTGDTQSPVPAIAYNEYPQTVDGLPVFVGTNRWLTLIVPLSHKTFLKLHITGSGQTQPLKDLLRTIKKI